MSDITIVKEDNVVEVIKQDNRVVIAGNGAQGVQGPNGPTGPIGPQGPQGPQGRDGQGQVSFQFTQNSPATTWTIVHNLGYNPNVAVVDSSGSEVEGDIKYLDDATVQVTFQAAFGGEAYLS